MAQVLKEDVRKKILESAKKELLANGLNASMRDIASGAKVTVGNLYRYYESKEEIIFTIISKPLLILNNRLEELTNSRLNFKSDVKTIGLTNDEIIHIFKELADTLTDIYSKYPIEIKILIYNPETSSELRIWFTNLISVLLKENTRIKFSSEDVLNKFASSIAISIFYGMRECFVEDIDKTRELINLYLYSFMALIKMEEAYGIY